MNIRLHYYGLRCPNDTKIPISLSTDGGRLFGHGLGSLTVQLSIVDDLASLAEGLDREEREMADDKDDDMGKDVTVDVEEIEEALKEEVLEVAKKVKPIQRVLFKVC